MNGFKTHTLESAPEASRPLLEQATKAYGFLPNLLGVLSESPVATEAYLTLSGIFAKSSLTPAESNVVLLTVSETNGCTYCVAAHAAAAYAQKVPVDVVNAVRNGAPLADPRLEAVRAFTTAVVRERGWVPPEQVQAFLDAGFTRAQALDVITAVSVKTLSTYTNHITGTPLDDALKAHEWTGKPIPV